MSEQRNNDEQRESERWERIDGGSIRLQSILSFSDTKYSTWDASQLPHYCEYCGWKHDETYQDCKRRQGIIVPKTFPLRSERARVTYQEERRSWVCQVCRQSAIPMQQRWYEPRTGKRIAREEEQ